MATNNATNTANPVTVSQGGSGDTSFTAYSVICAGTTSTGTMQNVSGVGTAGQILVSNGAGALPSWQNVSPGSGTVTLLQTQTANSSTSIDFTSLISNTYNNYFLIYNCFVSSVSANLNFLISTNNGGSWISTGYLSGLWTMAYNTSTITNLNSTTAGILSNTINASTGIVGNVYFYNLTNGKLFMSNGNNVSSGSNGSWNSSYNPTSNVNAIRIIPSSGNIANGTFSFYGIGQ